MPREALQSSEAKFGRALDVLIEEVKADRSILAAVLCGSLSHDTVWEKSDIDLIFVTADDRKSNSEAVALNADGVNVHACLMSRADFRNVAEGAIRNSFMHSYLAKGRLLYSHDETLDALCAGLRQIGERDLKLQLLAAATIALPPVYKAHKWFLTRRDLNYTALWILYAATPLARIEAMSARRLVDREVIPQALQLNPEFFGKIYTGLLNEAKTEKAIRGALTAIDEYLAERAPWLFAPVLEYLREVGEARSCTEIETYFHRSFNLEGVTTACEYLADLGLIGKVSTPVRLTKMSKVTVQELAFVSLTNRTAEELRDEF